MSANITSDKEIIALLQRLIVGLLDPDFKKNDREIQELIEDADAVIEALQLQRENQNR